MLTKKAILTCTILSLGLGLSACSRSKNNDAVNETNKKMAELNDEQKRKQEEENKKRLNGEIGDDIPEDERAVLTPVKKEDFEPLVNEFCLNVTGKKEVASSGLVKMGNEVAYKWLSIIHYLGQSFPNLTCEAPSLVYNDKLVAIYSVPAKITEDTTIYITLAFSFSQIDQLLNADLGMLTSPLTVQHNMVPMRDGVQLALRVARQVRPLGQVLAQQPVRVFIGPSLPRAVRIGKEDLDRELLSQLLVLGHLFPPIVGQGFPQRSRHMPEFFGKALTGTCGIRPVHSGQDDQACGPLHQGSDGRAIAGSLDEIAFPVARHRAGHHLGRTLGNRRHIGDLATAVRPPRPRPPRFACLTQRRQQCAPEGAAGQHIEPRIDRLGRKVLAHVVRIRALKPPGNLLGRAALRQMRPHILPQPGIQEFAGSPWLTGSGDRLNLRRAGPIGMAPRRVAGVFATQGAGRSAQDPRQHAPRLSLGQAQAQGLSVFSTQVCVTLFSHGNTLALQGW